MEAAREFEMVKALSLSDPKEFPESANGLHTPAPLVSLVSQNDS